MELRDTTQNAGTHHRTYGHNTEYKKRNMCLDIPPRNAEYEVKEMELGTDDYTTAFSKYPYTINIIDFYVRSECTV
jgi:hypothetical protein